MRVQVCTVIALILIGTTSVASARTIVRSADGISKGDACRSATNLALSPADQAAAGPVTSVSSCDCNMTSKVGNVESWYCTVQATHSQ
jgi:hypothetical protein